MAPLRFESNPVKFAAMRFSHCEIRELGKAWVAISVAFAIVLMGGITGIFKGDIWSTLLISSVTVGLGFILHELAHKYYAQKYGCWAEFRAFDKMLLLALGLSLFGFIIAAPGGVFIRGHINHKRNAVISFAGPMTNILLGLLFLFVGALFPLIRGAMGLGATINAWLAVFNLLPFMPFDGAKIYRWCWPYWVAAMAMAVLFWLGIPYIAGFFAGLI